MTCPVCGAVVKPLDKMRLVPAGFLEYALCQQCGVLFLQTLQRNGKNVANQQSVQRRKAWEAARLHYYQSRVRFIEREIRRSFTGLRQYRVGIVGAGAGTLLRVIEGGLWQTIAFENNTELVSELGKKYPKTRIVSGEFPDVIPRDLIGTCHVVTILELLERSPDPTRLLGAVGELLHKRGLCILETPNSKSLAWHLRGKNWAHYRPDRNRFLFDTGSLTRLAEITGFRVRGLRSVSGKGTESGLARMVALGKEALLRLPHWGSSLLAVLQKK